MDRLLFVRMLMFSVYIVIYITFLAFYRQKRPHSIIKRFQILHPDVI